MRKDRKSLFLVLIFIVANGCGVLRACHRIKLNFANDINAKPSGHHPLGHRRFWDAIAFSRLLYGSRVSLLLAPAAALLATVLAAHRRRVCRTIGWLVGTGFSGRNRSFAIAPLDVFS